ncbi:MAG: type II secretion system F family protein [Planctomycetia bacterium]|nr:type II secretion system F family protein [Planctomycetia bacterium]
MSLTMLSVLVGITIAVLFLAVAETLRRAIARQRSLVEETARQNLVELFIFIDPRQLLIINLLLFLLLPGLLWLLTDSLVFVILSAVIAIYFPRVLTRWLRKRRQARFIRQMPDALLMLASSLRAGMGLGSAIEVLAQEQPPPFSQEMGLLIRSQRLGVTFDEALKIVEKRLPLEDFKLFTAALRISRDVGGNLADTLESLAETLARKAEVEGKIRSLTAQGRIQAIVMTALPVLLIIVLRVLEPKPMSLLFNSVMGWAVLAAIVMMEIGGFFFIRRIVDIEI